MGSGPLPLVEVDARFRIIRSDEGERDAERAERDRTEIADRERERSADIEREATFSRSVDLGDTVVYLNNGGQVVKVR